MAIKDRLDEFAAELRKADRDAHIQWVALRFEIPGNADQALFYIDTRQLDIGFVKRKVLDATEAEEIELYEDYSMDVVNPKVYLEKLDIDVPVYNGETGMELVIVPLVLSEYSFNFTDYRDGIGGYLEFANNDRIITGWLDSGAEKKIGSLEKLLVIFGVTKIKR